MNNWQGIKNGMNLSQKFLDKIKPEYALKNKINGAEKQMESQILRLDQAHNKLKRNHDNIFKKIVEAQQTHDESKARTYAIELVEIKNHLKTLVTGFGEGPNERGYLTGIGTETAKGIKNSKITTTINKGF